MAITERPKKKKKRKKILKNSVNKFSGYSLQKKLEKKELTICQHRKVFFIFLKHISYLQSSENGNV